MLKISNKDIFSIKHNILFLKVIVSSMKKVTEYSSIQGQNVTNMGYQLYSVIFQFFFIHIVYPHH